MSWYKVLMVQNGWDCSLHVHTNTHLKCPARLLSEKGGWEAWMNRFLAFFFMKRYFIANLKLNCICYTCYATVSLCTCFLDYTEQVALFCCLSWGFANHCPKDRIVSLFTIIWISSHLYIEELANCNPYLIVSSSAIPNKVQVNYIYISIPGIEPGWLNMFQVYIR